MSMLLLQFLEHAILLLLPALTACIIFLRRGLRNAPVVGLAGLAGMALSGYLAFWVFFWAPLAGRIAGIVNPIAYSCYCIWSWRRLAAGDKAILLWLIRPLAFTLAASVLVMSTGFLYGGIADPIDTPRTRFSHRLPGDNDIPQAFAAQLRTGKISKPMAGEWLSSDRPPLQAGIFVSQYPLVHPPRGACYTAVAVFLQATSLYALWLLLEAFALEPRLQVLILAATLFSGFFFVNAFFVWPKLLAAAFMLGFCVMLFAEPTRNLLRQKTSVAILTGALLAFGLLSHGSSVFSLFGFLLTAIVLRKGLPWKIIGLIALTCALLYAPWTLYQKYFDPPGNRLLKWHLAGVMDVDGRSFPAALRASYRKLTWSAIIENRKQNLYMMRGYPAEFWSNTWNLVTHLAPPQKGGDSAWPRVDAFRAAQFFYLVPALGTLMAGPAFFALGFWRRRTGLFRISRIFWLLVLCSCTVWVLVLFSANAASLHQGSYASILLGFAAAVCSIWIVSPKASVSFVGVNVALSILVYGAFGSSPRVIQPKENVWEPVALLFVVLSALIIGALLRRLWMTQEPTAKITARPIVEPPL